jgi:gamma-glutamylputrescine oxidase
MSVSYWQDRSKNNVVNADIVIIGGGIAGLSSAYWITKNDPSLKVIILEKGELGAGATGRNAGFITCGSVEHFNRLIGKHGLDEAAQIWAFSEKNLQLLQEELISGHEKQILFEQRGSFSLASTESEIIELKESAALMEKLKIQVEFLDELAVKKRLGAEKFVGGIKYCGDASVHPILLLDLMKKNLEGKVEICESHEVFAVENFQGNKFIKTNKAYFETPVVVYATNGYSPLMHKFFDGKIFPTRGQILATESVPLFMEGPCYANFVLDYFRQLPTGQMVIGGFRQLQKDVEKGHSDETSDVIQDALEKFLHEHIPAVKKAKITHRWSGIMGFSVDGQPLIGALPGDEQSYFLGGFTGHGLGLAFHSAKVLADSLFGHSPIPTYLSAKRFL